MQHKGGILLNIFEILAPLGICLGTIVVAAVLYFVVSAIKTKRAERREREAYCRSRENKPTRQ